MSWMFSGCESLRQIDVPVRNVSSVTNMWSAFYGCASLEKLDLSDWDTSSVTHMGWMFYGCESLERIRIGKKYRMTNEDAFPSPTGRHSMWYCIKDGTWYSHEDIVSKRSGIACTYTNHKPESQTEPNDP